MKHTKLSKEKLRIIREALPNGSGVKMAAEFKFSTQYIYAVLNGHRNDDDIIMRSLEIIKESQDQLNKVIKSI